MDPELTLIFNDGSGEPVTVSSRRFTIGRSVENDLAIDSTNLSRRHAVIEIFDGQPHISDCGSQNGTEVNDRLITAGIALRNGDLIRLGGVCELVVQIGSADYQSGSSPASPPQVEPPAVASAFPQSQRSVTRPATTSFMSVPVIAAGGVVLIVIVAGLALMLTRSEKEKPPKRRSADVTDYSTPTPGPIESSTVELREPDSTATVSTAPETPVVGNDVIEKAAIQIMRRLSSDNKTYAFSEKALTDIRRKVGDYRGNGSLASGFGSLQRNSASIASQARQEGLEPGVLIYTALAQTDGGRAGDPAAAARSILPELLGLHATFGTEDADSSLILIAAYKMGGGGKKSHPLLPVLRRIANNPLTQRNVWFLRENGGLGDEPYDFVIKVLALGVISQSPRQFGIAAEPLTF